MTADQRRDLRQLLLVDGGLALALLLLDLRHIISVNDRCQCYPEGAGLLLLAVFTLPLAARRLAPVTVWFVVGSAAVVWQLAGYGDLLTTAFGALIPVYTVAAYSPTRVARIVGVVTLTLVAVVLMFETHVDFITDFLANGGPYAFAWAMGLAAQTTRASNEALRAQTARLQHEREERAKLAAAEERARIARDMHDIVAHSISVIAVQAEAGPVVVKSDASAAAAMFDTIAATARQSLGDIRRLLGVLRDAEPDRAPQPGLDRLEDLFDDVRATGRVVSFTVEGEPQPATPGLGLSAYRIVQEGITNALRHAGPTPIEVQLHWQSDGLEVRIRDDGVGPESVPSSDGRGLVGMHERAEAIGGSVMAGPRATGGWEVVAWLPFERGSTV